MRRITIVTIFIMCLLIECNNNFNCANYEDCFSYHDKGCRWTDNKCNFPHHNFKDFEDKFSKLNDCAQYQQSKDLMNKFGGHEQAAGLALDAKNIDELRLRISSASLYILLSIICLSIFFPSKILAISLASSSLSVVNSCTPRYEYPSLPDAFILGPIENPI